MPARGETNRAPWRVTLVGPCAAGKTTLETLLRAHGVAAHAVAQEHSHVPYLWQLSRPDALIFLNLRLCTLRARRGASWTRELLDAQRIRLAHAHAHAHLRMATDNAPPSASADRILAFLRAHDPAVLPRPADPALLRAFRRSALDPRSEP